MSKDKGKNGTERREKASKKKAKRDRGAARDLELPDRSTQQVRGGANFPPGPGKSGDRF